MLRMRKMFKGESESLDFYKYLCKKVGSEEVVRIRRLAFTIRDVGCRETVITSGSKGEGLDLNGSDLDIMIIDQSFKVYQSETEVKCSLSTPLIMNTEETQPCFVQLWLLNQNKMRTPNMFQNNHLGYNMLSNELFKQYYKNIANSFPTSFCGKIHGPCITDKNDTLDLAFCLKCDKWICEARQWVSRSRTTWPSTEIVSKIVSSGLLMVPTGCKGSINEHLEWRISFSVAEKILIFSFSHTQLLCYAMLKILLKEIIEKHEDLQGLLCSYFLKTLMFWISEETNTYVWRPVNILKCFRGCLQRLLYCVRYRILLHYFIPDNNLFYLRFNTHNEEQLITILTNLYEQGIHCFASSETLQDYHSLSSQITESLMCKNIRFLGQVMQVFCTFRIERQSPDIFRLLYNFVHRSRTALSRDLFALKISEASIDVPEKTQYKDSSGNKHHYFSYKHDLSHLIINLHSDALSGFLKLASFFYVHKNYIASLTVITYTLQKFSDEKIYFRNFSETKTLSHIQKYVLSLMKNEKLHTIIKSLTIHPFIFEKDSSIIPQELLPDVKWEFKYTYFHQLPFAHFLNFLCYYHLHDISSCKQSLERLRHVQLTLLESGSKCFIHESVNAVIFLGIGYQLMGYTYNAMRILEGAAKYDKFNDTTAKSRLSSLFT